MFIYMNKVLFCSVLSRTYFHGSKGVRAIEVLLYTASENLLQYVTSLTGGIPIIDLLSGLALLFLHDYRSSFARQKSISPESSWLTY